jgi:hypothetical protein
MPAQTRCIHCRTIEFVRREHVIVGANAVIEYYCGHCDHAWSVADSAPAPDQRRPNVRVPRKGDRARS